MPSHGPDGVTVSLRGPAGVVVLESEDGTNRLNHSRVKTLTREVEWIASREPLLPLVLTGRGNFFSAGADLNEISELDGVSAYEFALDGQRLMNAVEHYPATVVAAINGYCMGGGLDLALACDIRICSPNAIFGHRGAALGIMTGWGGTQRLPRLIGKGRALQMFLAAEKLHAHEALKIGLVDQVTENPLQAALDRLSLVR